MKTKLFAVLLVLSCSAVGFAASDEADPEKQLQIYPKNLARQHLGTNLFLFDVTSQSYRPTEAAAAWLDDDVTTGWPLAVGTKHYLLSLPGRQWLSNFTVSTEGAVGTVTLSVNDEPELPTSKSWQVVAKDVPLESINHKKLVQPFSRLGKYVLIETQVVDPKPLFSLDLYGERAAVNYDLRKRDQAIDTRGVFGAYTNDATAFNLAGLYAGGRIEHANSPEGYISWQKAIDGNAQSGIVLTASTTESTAIVKLPSGHAVSRLAVLTDGASQGKLEFFLLPETLPPQATPVAEGVEEDVSVQDAKPSRAASLEGVEPAATVLLEPDTVRQSVDFAATQTQTVLIRWTPENGTDPLNLRELGVYGDLSLATHEIALDPDAVAELGDYEFKGGKSSKDLKGVALPAVGSLESADLAYGSFADFGSPFGPFRFPVDREVPDFEEDTFPTVVSGPSPVPTPGPRGGPKPVADGGSAVALLGLAFLMAAAWHRRLQMA